MDTVSNAPVRVACDPCEGTGDYQNKMCRHCAGYGYTIESYVLLDTCLGCGLEAGGNCLCRRASQTLTEEWLRNVQLT